MTDWVILLILAISGIIGYLLMGLIDRSIGRHTGGSDQHEREKGSNKHAETGEPERTYPGLSFFIRI